MEVKIGVQYAARELEIDTESSADDVAKTVSEAVSTGGVLNLVDKKGKRLIVPVDKLAYVEIADVDPRPLGFGRL
ncbi:MAG TPA: DUF3107 domain-containing protein [Mycobacteriales bacterium]|nr:DUF3107 domain-containing protein [Mycobacteriales bacterium]